MSTELNDYDSVTPYTDAELGTLRRCQEGKPVSADDLLMMVSTDLLVLQKCADNAIEHVLEHAKPYENEEFWDAINELWGALPELSRHCEQWRAEKTGGPQRQEVDWRPFRRDA